MATSQARAVCVVDDDVSLPRALQILLRAAGFTVGAVGIGGGVLARGPGCGRPLLAVKRVSDRDGSARAAPRPRAGARAPRSARIDTTQTYTSIRPPQLKRAGH